ncbi:MAG: ACT domain-containing protein [Clostridia bacterium]|nr:ACT domain-containing protein [Clostridia bacterium]MBP5780117.1 ACT domain-containing protein [Clostridia bacterium]
MIKGVLTVIGKDRVGIIAALSRILAEANCNILDISQTTMDDIFTMTMLVDVTDVKGGFGPLAETLKKAGDDMGLRVQLCHVDIFNAMHKI